jgi:predicted anti-sigma-YlaC factor YlaD
MKTTACLSQQDLTLLYYRDPDLALAEAEQHLTACSDCRSHFQRLSQELQSLPDTAAEVDTAAVTRLTAKVSDRLSQRRRLAWPALGGGLAAAAALLIAVVIWQPTTLPQPQQTGSIQLADHPMQSPDIDLLEDFELLNELELLRQIEGV